MKKDIRAFVAYATENYPLLVEILDRVGRELIMEGIDLRGLAEGDLSVLETQHIKPDPRR